MPTSRRILVALVATLALVAAACGDDDADTTAPPAGTDGEAEGGVLEFQPLEPGAVTFTALQRGDIDVALLFSTQGVIAENGWVVLDDDRGLQPAENLVPAIRTEVLDDTIEDALNTLSAGITTEDLTELNRRVDGDLEEPEDVARDYIGEIGVLDDIEEGAGSGQVTIGSTNFSEQEIMAHLYGIVLEHAGYQVTVRTQLGPREVVFASLEAGELDLTPEYVGSLLEFLEEGTATSDTDESVEALREQLADRDLTVLEPTPAEDKNALVVTRETADRYGLSAISDLLGVTDVLVFGAPQECPQRPLCMIGLREVYGLQFEGV